MRHQRRSVRFVLASLGAAAVWVAAPLVANAVPINAFVTPLEAAAGQGWAIHPTGQTSGATSTFVEGPLTPPAGRGSLQMTVAATTDRALVYTVPKPGSGTAPPDIDAIVPTSWSDLSGAFSTFTAETTLTESSIPSLRIVGYQVYNDANPALSTGFTTLNLEGVYQGTVVANQWQTWTLGPSSIVWQTNDDDGFCGPAAADRCTLAEFAEQYPDGAWGVVQVGLGAGPATDATGFADLVRVSDGTTTFEWDFEAASPSTATIAAGAATATGGSVDITLNSSAGAALGSTVFNITFSGTSAVSPAPVTLPAGTSQTLNFPLPFGTTNVTVTAQGASLAAAPITFTQQVPTTTIPPSTTVSPTLPATGSDSSGVIWVAIICLLGGLGVVMATRRGTRSN